jgi:hypothetical protein
MSCVDDFDEHEDLYVHARSLDLLAIDRLWIVRRAHMVSV